MSTRMNNEVLSDNEERKKKTATDFHRKKRSRKNISKNAIQKSCFIIRFACAFSPMSNRYCRCFAKMPFFLFFVVHRSSALMPDSIHCDTTMNGTKSIHCAFEQVERIKYFTIHFLFVFRWRPLSGWSQSSIVSFICRRSLKSAQRLLAILLVLFISLEKSTFSSSTLYFVALVLSQAHYSNERIIIRHFVSSYKASTFSNKQMLSLACINFLCHTFFWRQKSEVERREQFSWAKRKQFTNYQQKVFSSFPRRLPEHRTEKKVEENCIWALRIHVKLNY